MMYKFFLSAIMISTMISTSAFLWSCSSAKVATLGVPACILQKIDTLKAQPKSNPPAKVEEYVYNGKTVYLFNSPCCDQYHLLYSDACEVVCAPSGGITGGGDGRCKDFSDKAVFIRTVWQDKR